MRRLFALLYCLVVPLAMVAADAEPEPENDAKTILGTWKIVKATKGGEVPDAEMLKSQFIFKAEKVIVTRPSGGEDPASYKLYPNKNPKEIDISPTMGAEQTVRGIYKFEKGQLLLLVNKPGAERPKKYDEKTDVMLLLERVKK